MAKEVIWEKTNRQEDDREREPKHTNPCTTLTGSGLRCDLWQIQQPISDVLVLEGDAAEVLATVHVPCSRGHAHVLRHRVLGMTQHHLSDNTRGGWKGR